jgi:hypothetical protein
MLKAVVEAPGRATGCAFCSGRLAVDRGEALRGLSAMQADARAS